MMVRRWWLAALLCAATVAHAAGDTLHVGSKRFTESYILGEVLTQTAAPHAQVEHLQGLGNTAIVLAALQAGRIDVYPEYLGTIDLEILKHKQPATLEQMRKELAAMGLGVAVPLGFNNTYALAMRADGRTSSASWRAPACALACRTSSSAARMAGRDWRRAMACRSGHQGWTTASPTRR
jgi:osmoprotectant transport system permease protein